METSLVMAFKRFNFEKQPSLAEERHYLPRKPAQRLWCPAAPGRRGDGRASLPRDEMLALGLCQPEPVGDGLTLRQPVASVGRAVRT